jgi:hypothetical protein
MRHVKPGVGVGAVVIALALVAIGMATLVPGRGPGAEPSFGCIVCGERGLADAIVNVILFVPLGAGLALLGTRVRGAVLGGALASALVEFAQLTVIPGRDPSVGDLLFNTLGTVAGYGVLLLAPILARLDDRTAARLSIAAALDVVLAVALTGWLFQPSFPRTAYWGQWTPNLGHLEWYRGRVRSSRIDGVAVRSRRIEDSGWARDALLAGKPIEVEATAGPPVGRLGSLFSVYDENRTEIVLLGPDRDDLVFRYRTRASAWRLDQPDLRLRDGMRAITAGQEIAVRSWSPASGEYCLRIGDRAECGLGLTIGTGWGLLLYAESFPPWFKQLLATGWTAALLVPTGFLIRRRWESVIALAMSLAAISALPIVMALRPTALLEWLGVGFGLAGGGVAAWWVRSPTRPYRPDRSPRPPSGHPAGCS